MGEKDITGFKIACKNYFLTLDLNSLRTYGRALQLQKPSTLRKRDLIEAILKVLCGETVSKRNHRGAPIKNSYLNKEIFETVARLQKEYFCEDIEAADVEKAECAVKAQAASSSILVELAEESRLDPLQFTIRFSLLNKEQRRLFIAFLNSL